MTLMLAAPVAVITLLGLGRLAGPRAAVSTGPGQSHDGRPVLAPQPVALAGAVPSASPASAQRSGLQLRQGCVWGQPGRNPYRGSTEQALQAAGLPDEVVAEVAAKRRAGQRSDRLTIRTGEIRAAGDGRQFDPAAVALTFGHTLCLNSRVNFVSGHVEQADLFEVRDAQGRLHSVMVPDVCGNVSVLGRRGERGLVSQLAHTLAQRSVELAGLADALAGVSPADAAAGPAPAVDTDAAGGDGAPSPGGAAGGGVGGGGGAAAGPGFPVAQASGGGAGSVGGSRGGAGTAPGPVPGAAPGVNGLLAVPALGAAGSGSSGAVSAAPQTTPGDAGRGQAAAVPGGTGTPVAASSPLTTTASASAPAVVAAAGAASAVGAAPVVARPAAVPGSAASGSAAAGPGRDTGAGGPTAVPKPVVEVLRTAADQLGRGSTVLASLGGGAGSGSGGGGGGAGGTHHQVPEPDSLWAVLAALAALRWVMTRQR